MFKNYDEIRDRESVQTITDAFVAIRSNPELLAVALLRKHRTIQQSTVSAILEGLHEYATLCEENRLTDPRNTDAVEYLLRLRNEPPIFRTV